MILGRSPLARQPLACGATGGSTSLPINPANVLAVRAMTRDLGAAANRDLLGPAPNRTLKGY